MIRSQTLDTGGVLVAVQDPGFNRRQNIIPMRPKTLDDAMRDHILQTLRGNQMVRRRKAPGEMLAEGSNGQRAFPATA